MIQGSPRFLSYQEFSLTIIVRYNGWQSCQVFLLYGSHLGYKPLPKQTIQFSTLLSYLNLYYITCYSNFNNVLSFTSFPATWRKTHYTHNNYSLPASWSPEVTPSPAESSADGKRWMGRPVGTSGGRQS